MSRAQLLSNREEQRDLLGSWRAMPPLSLLTSRTYISPGNLMMSNFSLSLYLWEWGFLWEFLSLPIFGNKKPWNAKWKKNSFIANVKRIALGLDHVSFVHVQRECNKIAFVMVQKAVHLPGLCRYDGIELSTLCIDSIGYCYVMILYRCVFWI